jgi:hypothetical protein
VLDKRDLRRREADEPTRKSESQSPAAHPLLDLQSAAGNRAVGLLVQRAPKDGPATTDAPGALPKRAKPGPKKAASDVRARVIGFQIDEGQARITISAGADQGVKVGMSASLLEANGKEYADFTIEKVSGGTSIAHVKATQDQVSANPSLIIKASKFVEEDLSDKQF